MDPRDRDIAEAFDSQAERFERSPVQADPAALRRLVLLANLPPGTAVLDAGCGPGLVAEAFLEAGHHVLGVDLSAEMVRRARARCARFGERARFVQGSVLELPPGERFGGAVSRFVLHHVADPAAFLRRQADLLGPRGVLVASDQTTDPDPAAAAWHDGIDRGRDRSHAHTLSPGRLVDLLAAAGLVELRLVEEPYDLDFDEWVVRGSPSEPKDAVRARLLSGRARGFEPVARADGGVTIRTWRALVRGVKPAEGAPQRP